MPSTRMPCPNCACCEAERWCDGCYETLCGSCWAEHNEDAECHDCPPSEPCRRRRRYTTKRYVLLIPFKTEEPNFSGNSTRH